MIFISRSAVVTRKTCEMKRFWNYHAKPFAQEVPGIVLKETTPKSQLPKVRGQIFHEAAAKMFAQEDWATYIDKACAELLPPELVQEQSVLIRRALLGWSIVRQEVLQDYEVVSAEQEWTWNLNPEVAQSLRLDRVLRRKEDGNLAIFDFKTMKSPDRNWIERMQNSEQTHLYIQALKERTNEWVLGMIYDGLIIGSLDEEGHQKSPFVRAYRKKDGSYSAKYVAGAPAVLTLDWPDSKWLEWIQQSGMLNELYCTTGPLLPTTEQLMRTKAATASAELRWHKRTQYLEEIENNFGLESEEYQNAFETLVERNPDACLKYGWEYACPYHKLCWGGEIPTEDIFTSREDHHTIQQSEV